MKLLATAVYLFAAATVPAFAQSLSPAELQKLVDERIANINPYQTLLNDPDPERSRIAMQIMLESSDPQLVRMALEFGILSPNPTVRRVAFEAWLTNGPVLTIRFDGSDTQNTNFNRTVRNYWNGALGENIGYWLIPVGPFLEDKRCFVNVGTEKCFITVNSDGAFLTPERMNARGTISESGILEGTATLHNMNGGVPFSIQLID